MGVLSPETEMLLQRYSSLRGETPDALVRAYLNQVTPELADQSPRTGTDWAEVHAILARIDALPVLNDRPWREIRDEAWGDAGR